MRNTPTATALDSANWGNGACGLIYDGTNGGLPAFAYTDQYWAVDYAAREHVFGFSLFWPGYFLLAATFDQSDPRSVAL